MPGMEPRMRPRPKGPQFVADDLAAMLVAFGDDNQPLPGTIRALDDIITDFVIETCHAAESHARHAARAKIKVDDFQFALRHDSKKLGRVQELLDMDREIAKKRRAFDVDEGKVRKDAADKAAGNKRGAAGADGAEKGPGRGRKKVRVQVGEDDVGLDGDGDDDGGSGITNVKAESSLGGSRV